MSPAEIVVQWPTADEIGRAIVVAAALEGVDWNDVLTAGVGCVHARYYAALALAHEFPTAPRRKLSRKCGLETALSTARADLKRRAPWFDLDRLNAVRAACGWSDMTTDEALAAPLLYCGRHWTEFLDRTVEAGNLSEASAESSADTGPAREEAPVENHTPTEEDETEPVAASCSLVVGDDLGGPSSEKGFGADAGVVGLASATLQSSDGRAEGGQCKSELGARLDEPCQPASAKDAAKGSSADPLKSSEGRVGSAPELAHLLVHRPSEEPTIQTGRVASEVPTVSGDISRPIPNDIGRTQFSPRQSATEQSSADPARFAAKQGSRVITTITQSPSMSDGSAKSIISKSIERKAVEPVVEPGPSDAEPLAGEIVDASALARTERRKAWLRGEPPTVAEIEAPPIIDLPPLADFTRRPEPAAPVTACVTDLQAAFERVEAPVETRKAVSSPPPKPLTPSPAAAALAGAARALQAAKAARKAPPPSDERIVERVEPQDTRRAPDDYRIFRASERTSGVVSYRKADPPPERRGMVVVTGDLMGDPGERHINARREREQAK